MNRRPVNIKLNSKTGLYFLIILLAMTGGLSGERLLCVCESNTVWAASPPASNDAAAHTLIDKANNQANAGHYTQAIPLYEKAIPMLPAGSTNVATLKRNLSVLCNNASVEAINAKKYDEANLYIDKALKVSPNDMQLKKTKAAIFFSEAMDLRDKGVQNPESQDFEKIENLLRNAMQWNPAEPNFKKALAANYVDNGVALANQSQFEESAKLLEAAKKLQPDSATIKSSLVNVYLSLASENADKREQWTQKALEADPSDDTKKKVNDLLNPPITAPPLQGADNPPVGPEVSDVTQKESIKDSKPRLPAKARKLTIQDMMLDIENQLGIERDPKLTLKQRVENAELQVFGTSKAKAANGTSTQELPLGPRIQTLYANVFGSNLAEAQSDVRQAPVETSANSYLDEIFKVTDGKVIRWGKFPVRVYVEDPLSKDDKDKYKDMQKEKPLAFQPEYKQAVLDGLNVWKEATRRPDNSSFITYVEVKSENQADVVFKWAPTAISKFAQPAEKLADYYKDFGPPKESKVSQGLKLASSFTPGIFSLAPQVVAAGIDYKQAKKIEAIQKESEVTLGLEPAQALAPAQARQYIQNLAAHEFGHILGLKFNSPQEGDLLNAKIRSDSVARPSVRDLETLRQLYNRPANVILNVAFPM